MAECGAHLMLGKARARGDLAAGGDQLAGGEGHALMPQRPEARGQEQKEKDMQRLRILKPLPGQQAAIEADIAAGMGRCVAHRDLLMT